MAHPDSIRVLVGEAAGEGAEGMRRVARVIHTRAKERRLSVDDVVRQPKQFSAYDRTDLDAFILKQPKPVVDAAYEAMQLAEQDGPWANHYLTRELYESPQAPSWSKKMKVIDRFGNHVFLTDRR